jgi:hypothetical protein
MKLKSDLLLDVVAMENHHFPKHFRTNSEDLTEEMAAMGLTLFFKVNI